MTKFYLVFHQRLVLNLAHHDKVNFVQIRNVSFHKVLVY